MPQHHTPSPQNAICRKGSCSEPQQTTLGCGRRRCSVSGLSLGIGEQRIICRKLASISGQMASCVNRSTGLASLRNSHSPGDGLNKLKFIDLGSFAVLRPERHRSSAHAYVGLSSRIQDGHAPLRAAATPDIEHQAQLQCGHLAGSSDGWARRNVDRPEPAPPLKVRNPHHLRHRLFCLASWPACKRQLPTSQPWSLMRWVDSPPCETDYKGYC